jgi:cell division protein FtsL
MSDKGPFEVWIKENGCLIFISVYQSSILITTKHECQSRYTEKAQEWLNLHLKQSGISEQHLIDFLVRNQVTLAFEVNLIIKIMSSSVMMILKSMSLNILLKRGDCCYMELFAI